ncbi:NfeD family protein [Albidovulum sediminicola]|uniref:NfeD-like C-terminal domain-containing protein n=1 Tax=Albidovulum sediminicola TaxID=2984331 RepID=A0ABT2YYQ8_9RHOB|nr:hypothetical protein [Defluviimonas sp. WL0075]MCV2864011.1 hypothetical protein [Defluviimonas sp. WL0075]
MEFWQLWWVWLTAGVVLAILEVAVPGFIFLGFAGGATLTGIGIWLGLVGGTLPALLLVFAVASLASWAVLRAIFGRRRGQVKIWEKDINDN